jgi:hypothetical protein
LALERDHEESYPESSPVSVRPVGRMMAPRADRGRGAKRQVRNDPFTIAPGVSNSATM